MAGMSKEREKRMGAEEAAKGSLPRSEVKRLR
jgi:hypothetical protein